MNLDQILLNLGNDALPSGIQFVMVLMAAIGAWVFIKALVDIYYLISDDNRYSRNGATINGALIRLFFAVLLITPSVTMWRAADLFMRGGGVTQSNILAYVNGTNATSGYCDKFSNVISLAFIIVGLVALYVAWRNADDQARGFSQNGYRLAVPYFIGGLACVFINDVIAIIGNTLNMHIGFDQLCSAIGAG